MSTYSFLDVVAAFTGVAGAFSLSEGGVAEEGITVSMLEDKGSMVIGADGNGMHSLHAGKAGTVTVRLLKTNPLNQKLMDAYNFETISSANYGNDTITIRDPQRGDSVTARQCGWRKIPDLAYAKDGNTVEWSWNAIKIDEILGSGNPEA